MYKYGNINENIWIEIDARMEFEESEREIIEELLLDR